MPRPESLERLNRALEKLDDEQIAHLADIAADLAQDGPGGEFTEEDLASIDRGREDFKAGRTYTIEEIRARSDVFLRS